VLTIATRRIPALIVTALLLGVSGLGGVARQPQTGFASQIAALSEPGGYFDTDNLISNERSYLQVMPALDRARLNGGAYLGVGPDQNFTYIARLRPAIAFIVDIRRDNLLLHLLFKALFQQSHTRAEYLALLFGRRVPANLDRWRAEPIDRLADYIESTPADAGALASLRERTDAVIARFGVPLTAEDTATIDRFHRSFIAAGLGLRFESTGRGPQSYYPTYRELILAVDPMGRQGSFLADEEGFQFVKALQARNLVIPVVGNLAGPRALLAIGEMLTRRGEQLAAFYTSNVEFYLARAGTLDRFLDNLARLPRMRNAVVIRSTFGRFNGGSASMAEPVEELVESRAR
jgi:hypothetical protein